MPFDFRPVEREEQFVEGDVRDIVALAGAMDEADAVVHAAACTEVHLQAWSAEDFWSIDVTRDVPRLATRAVGWDPAGRARVVDGGLRRRRRG